MDYFACNVGILCRPSHRRPVKKEPLVSALSAKRTIKRRSLAAANLLPSLLEEREAISISKKETVGKRNDTYLFLARTRAWGTGLQQETRSSTWQTRNATKSGGNGELGEGRGGRDQETAVLMA